MNHLLFVINLLSISSGGIIQIVHDEFSSESGDSLTSSYYLHGITFNNSIGDVLNMILLHFPYFIKFTKYKFNNQDIMQSIKTMNDTQISLQQLQIFPAKSYINNKTNYPIINIETDYGLFIS